MKASDLRKRIEVLSGTVDLLNEQRTDVERALGRHRSTLPIAEDVRRLVVENDRGHYLKRALEAAEADLKAATYLVFVLIRRGLRKADS